MSESPVRRQRAVYSMPFKLSMVEKSLQPGTCVARLARENGINDNLLFTWRQRYRHLLAVSADDAGDDHLIAGQTVVPVVVEPARPVASPVMPAPSLTLLTKPQLTCEITLGRARFRLSGSLTPAMLTALVRELKGGRR